MRKPASKTISDETKRRILVTAWDLIEESGRVDIGLAEIAQRAGMSRQTLFYAFGNRAGLLLAMVRHKDTMSNHVARIRAEAADQSGDPESLVRMAEAWLDYLPIIYPVGILLDAAALTDADTATAWDDRMVGTLLHGLRRLAGRVRTETGHFDNPDDVADELWAAIHPSMWRRLVVDCGWAPEHFHANRMRVVRRTVEAYLARPL